MQSSSIPGVTSGHGNVLIAAAVIIFVVFPVLYLVHLAFGSRKNGKRGRK